MTGRSWSRRTHPHSIDFVSRNGVETVLKSAAVIKPAQGSRFTLSCQATGGALTLRLDGVSKATVADPAATVSGSVGFAMGGSSGGGIFHRADDFSAIVQ